MVHTGQARMPRRFLGITNLPWQRAARPEDYLKVELQGRGMHKVRGTPAGTNKRLHYLRHLFCFLSFSKHSIFSNQLSCLSTFQPPILPAYQKDHGSYQDALHPRLSPTSSKENPFSAPSPQSKSLIMMMTSLGTGLRILEL